MDKSVFRSKTAKRLRLAAILCCAGATTLCNAGTTAMAEESASRETTSTISLHAVPLTDIVTFRTPANQSEKPAANSDVTTPASNKIGYRFGQNPHSSPQPLASTQTQDSERTLAKLIGSGLADAASESIADETQTLPDPPSVARVEAKPMKVNLKPFIAPESVADMVRSADPVTENSNNVDSGSFSESTSSRRRALASRGEDSLSAFPLPSMEILHAGQPVHQDAVNFRSPDFKSTQNQAQPRSAINAVEDQIVTLEEALANRTRKTAGGQGFQMIAMDQIEPPNVSTAKSSAINSQEEVARITSSIHANRLRELAVVSLRDAKNRLQRRATHSAQKFALEALRLSIDVEDSIDGGNHHAQDLQAGLAAVRESRDFGGPSGSVNTRTMQRMVAVHETSILKNEDLAKMSAIEATQAYLQDAHQRLVRAADGSAIAAEALMLLGTIEKQMPQRENAQTSVLSLTYHAAAVEIVPHSAAAHRTFGKTLLEQGMVRPAIASIQQSIAISPSRSGYEALLQASRQTGDADTARYCLAALADANLPSETAVTRLTPGQFASSYRPQVAPVPSSRQNNSSASSSSVAKQQKAAQPNLQNEEPQSPRLSFRSLFSFGR